MAVPAGTPPNGMRRHNSAADDTEDASKIERGPLYRLAYSLLQSEGLIKHPVRLPRTLGDGSITVPHPPPRASAAVQVATLPSGRGPPAIAGSPQRRGLRLCLRAQIPRSWCKQWCKRKIAIPYLVDWIKTYDAVLSGSQPEDRGSSPRGGIGSFRTLLHR
jgi:hypothetical protein